ncbi:MAG: thioredoxin domain-containing protein [Bacteroidales bacterium]|nr:thioredoxin domain-containing protein [Bacteroidales bacterium]
MEIDNLNTSGKANKLIHESSLYLRQHASNPVDWHPWGEEALSKAKAENKPLLISIGYSSCHWCHVMEHESFSDVEVADFMNRNFVNIKIDREERPDLDQLYMEAVQLLHGHGGWPLNCFALPDGRPFWGATYFKKSQWLEVLDQIISIYTTEPHTLLDQAEKISSGIGQMNLVIAAGSENKPVNFDPAVLYKKLADSFDKELGGFSGAPKFPMPTIYRFLLHYNVVSRNNSSLKHVILTLKRMAAGGIYDQVGGGFARYSTDRYWKVPHFEKMLYDNAQLIVLYCEAYLLSKEEKLRDTAIETIAFLEREMGSPETGFSSSVDADSPEGEGSFYTFSLDELNELLGVDAQMLIDYWKAGKEGKWEGNKNILLATVELDSFLAGNQLDKAKFDQKLQSARSILLEYRNKRPAPAIDPKIITSWNALMVQAYVNLYRVRGNSEYLDSAKQLASFILDRLGDESGGLLHVDDKGKSIAAFLDDYAATILALISLHSSSFEEKWALKAAELAESAITQFYNDENGLFYFSGTRNEKTFALRQEIHDNVMPASNSMMMESLYLLGQIFENDRYLNIAQRAVFGMAESILKHPSAFSNWARLLLMMQKPFYTFAITGNNANDHLTELLQEFSPQMLIAGERNESQLPILRNRFKRDETLIYVCSGNECYPPVKTPAEAMKYLK